MFCKENIFFVYVMEDVFNIVVVFYSDPQNDKINKRIWSNPLYTHFSINENIVINK